MIGSKLALFKELSFLKQKSQFSERTIRTTFVQKDYSNGTPIAEVESSRTSLASRTFSRTHFKVLGLEGQVLGLEASSPRKLACPRLEDSTIL